MKIEFLNQFLLLFKSYFSGILLTNFLLSGFFKLFLYNP